MKQLIPVFSVLKPGFGKPGGNQVTNLQGCRVTGRSTAALQQNPRRRSHGYKRDVTGDRAGN